jgi:hypothetical protein
VGYWEWDVDPWADMEALEQERLDADMLQAEMVRHGNAIARARAAGRCTHGSAVGYRDPPVYPEQEGLRPGQSRCTEQCGRVFASDQEWHEAMEAAVYDEPADQAADREAGQ